MPHPGLIRGKNVYFILVTSNKRVNMELVSEMRMMDKRLKDFLFE
jgi:hypothetical protein